MVSLPLPPQVELEPKHKDNGTTFQASNIFSGLAAGT
jgi:hypothetical protein